MRIELCGPLGVGKTTLAVNLSQTMGWTLIREPVESHPFLEPFYARPAAHAFEKNLFFLLDYLHQIKSCEAGDFIFDHSAVVHRSYATLNNITTTEKPVYQALDRLTETIGPPDLLINLVCSSDVIMQRIRKRGRSFESEVNLDYVVALNEEIQRQVKFVSHYMPVLNLDAASYDFDARPEDNDKIVAIIRNALAIAPEERSALSKVRLTA
jgi:deoxyadenosine/deoxycytidine kinase